MCLALFVACVSILRVEMVWGQFLSGQLAMVAGVMIAVTVMAMLSVLILSQLVPSVREMTSPGI